MKKVFTFTLLSLFVSCIIGCDDSEFGYVLPRVLEVSPPSGSTIETDTIIIVTSDSAFNDVEVSIGSVIVESELSKS